MANSSIASAVVQVDAVRLKCAVRNCTNNAHTRNRIETEDVDGIGPLRIYTCDECFERYKLASMLCAVCGKCYEPTDSGWCGRQSVAFCSKKHLDLWVEKERLELAKGEV